MGNNPKKAKCAFVQRQEGQKLAEHVRFAGMHASGSPIKWPICTKATMHPEVDFTTGILNSGFDPILR